MREEKDPGYIEVRNDPTMAPLDRPPLINSRGNAIASEHCALSILQRNDGMIVVSLAFYIDKLGIYHPMTADGARMLGNQLLRAADVAEADAADGAKDQLDTALRKGPAA